MFLAKRAKARLKAKCLGKAQPLSVHYPSMNGKLQLDMHDGRFLQADPGIAKLLGAEFASATTALGTRFP